MATRVLLIEAGPTPWDIEGRLVGRRPLPLTAEAIDSIRRILDSLSFTVDSVYRPKGNEACDQTARLIAEKFNLSVRHNADLEATSLGLWEGLTPEELKFRFPTVFPQWMENPIAVTPPDGESLETATKRISAAVKRIAKRNRGFSAALALRPQALQIARGTLAGESLNDIAAHLHERQPVATIETE